MSSNHQAGDDVGLRLTVVPDRGVPVDGTTVVTAVAYLDGRPGRNVEVSPVDGDRARWIGVLTSVEPGEYDVVWTVTGTGAGVQTFTFAVAPALPQMPAEPNLATVNDLAVYTGRPVEDAGRLRQHLAAASAVVRDHCGWHLGKVSDQTVQLDTDGGRILTLPAMNITAVNDVEIRGTAVIDYTWSPSGALHRHAGWPHEYRAVSVTYSGGLDPIPPQIVAAVCSIADRGLARPAGGLMQSETIGDYTYRISPLGNEGITVLTDGEQRVLDRFRIVDEREPVWM